MLNNRASISIDNVILLSTPLYVTSLTTESRQLVFNGDITGGTVHLQAVATTYILSNTTLSHGMEIERGLVRVSSGATLSASHAVAIRGSGNLELYNHISIGGLTLNATNLFNETGATLGPRVTLGTGQNSTVTLNGNVSYTNASGGLRPDGEIHPNLNLGTATRTFSASDTSNGNSVALVLTGTVTSATGGVGMTKTGDASLRIFGAMSFSGPTTIQGGFINTANPNILAPQSTVVLSGGELHLYADYGTPFQSYHNQQIGGLSSTLATAAVLIGDATLTLGANNSSNTYAGRISGSGKLIKVGTGTQTFSGDNSQFKGVMEVQRGVLAVTTNNSLGATSATTKVNAGGTLRFAGSFTHSGTLDMTAGGNVDVASGLTVTHQNASIFGGFLMGPGTHAVIGNTFIAGTTIQPGTIINHTGLSSQSLQNVSSGGRHQLAVNGTVNWNGGMLTSAGQIIVPGLANLNTSSFESNGTIQVNPSGTIAHSGGPLVLGGGSVTNLGQYNPATGAVTPGGAINLGTNDLVVRGGFLRNNGVITTTGNLVIDYGGLAKGAGDYDVGGTQLINGGQFLAGNSPGLVRNSNLTVTGPSLVGGDLNNATGTVGGFASSANGNTTNSGWSAIEYGNSANTASGLTLQRGAAGKAQWQFRTTLNDGVGNTPGAPANFDPTQSYSWLIFRPRTNASATNPEPTDQLNTVATITLLDPAGTVLANTDANLNATLEFNRSLFLDPNTNLPITPAVGNFVFAFGLDLEGRPGTTISLVYQPVPEPTIFLVVAAVSAGFWQFRRRFVPAGN